MIEQATLVKAPPASAHKVGLRVPSGGSHCANCRYLRILPLHAHCALPTWVNAPKRRGGGGGDTRLPLHPTVWCCDGWGLG